MNTKKEEKATENTRGLEHFGKDFRLKITRSLSPTPFKKKTQQIISTRSSLSSSGSSASSSSTPQQARRSSFLKPMDLLFGSESSMNSDQSSPSSPRNMTFLGQIYREQFQWIITEPKFWAIFLIKKCAMQYELCFWKSLLCSFFCWFLGGETTSIRGAVRQTSSADQPVWLKMFHNLLHGYMILLYP